MTEAVVGTSPFLSLSLSPFLHRKGIESPNRSVEYVSCPPVFEIQIYRVSNGRRFSTWTFGPNYRDQAQLLGPDDSVGLPPAVPSAVATQCSGGFFPPPTSTPNSSKKARGRPPGSTNKKQCDALGSSGVGFTPHVITVEAGEDVCSKIMSFSQNGPRAVCILTANGATSNVTLRQPAMSAGTVTYQGLFEILSLSGSYLFSENGGQRSRTGGLSVSLSGPDGRVLGGGVTDGGHKELWQADQIEQPPFTAPHKLAPIRAGMTGTSSSPPSLGTLSESSGGPGSPFNHSAWM